MGHTSLSQLEPAAARTLNEIVTTAISCRLFMSEGISKEANDIQGMEDMPLRVGWIVAMYTTASPCKDVSS